MKNTAALADPPVLHAVAEQYGHKVANGDMSHAAAVDALARICLWHKKIGLDLLDAALDRAVTTLGQAAFASELKAAQDIRLGLQPLLARRANSAELRAAAYRLADARLLRSDCDVIVQSEIQARLSKVKVHA